MMDTCRTITAGANAGTAPCRRPAGHGGPHVPMGASDDEAARIYESAGQWRDAADAWERAQTTAHGDRAKRLAVLRASVARVRAGAEEERNRASCPRYLAGRSPCASHDLGAPGPCDDMTDTSDAEQILRADGLMDEGDQ